MEGGWGDVGGGGGGALLRLLRPGKGRRRDGVKSWGRVECRGVECSKPCAGPRYCTGRQGCAPVRLYSARGSALGIRAQREGCRLLRGVVRDPSSQSPASTQFRRNFDRNTFSQGVRARGIVPRPLSRNLDRTRGAWAQILKQPPVQNLPICVKLLDSCWRCEAAG